MSFEKELEQLINRHSLENGSNTPDFILASYLYNCLQIYNDTLKQREKWYGREILSIKPTIADLEAILSSPSSKKDIVINPDGSVRVK